VAGQTTAVRLSGREPAGLLVERERDLAVVEEAVAEAVWGRAALVVIEGPAGIGKTRLLTEGRRLAREVGVRVLVARASELEGELAFGVVRQLFEGALDAVGLEPLGSAATAADEVLGGLPRAAGEPGSMDVSFAILHSLYRVTVTLAADSPLVIAVDDLHWSDEPSLRFLNYLIRRLEGLGVTVLCTMRPRERRARASLVTEIVGDPLPGVVCPRPLSSKAAAQLVGEGLGADADQAFVTACHTATGGNPLLLRELISTMQLEGVLPDSTHVSAVSDLGPRAVSRAVLVRLGRLTADALRLARATSVMHDGAELRFVADLAGLPPDDAAAVARALVAAEIFSNDSRALFVHPLVGAAVYEDMPALDRSLAHERAARLLRERGSPVATVAVHLALAPARGEEWVCDVLEEAARESLRAGSPASAARYLTRALSETPPPEHRARLLLELGSAEAMLHIPFAIEHLTEAFEQGSDVAVRGAAALTLARTLLFYARADESAALIRRARAEMETGSDLSLALEALELMAAAYGNGRPVPAERLDRRLAPGAGTGAKMLATVISRRWAYAGENAEAAHALRLKPSPTAS
jgi:predicted ATPase